MQKTDFRYEIIINDDCSNDGTTEIIKEYVEKYPNIIKAIFHEENLYSKGERGMMSRFVYPHVRGKYVAICEGDDYWTDPYKLQKQVDYMEAHPECAICFHPVMVHDQRTGEDHPDALAQVPILTTSKDLARIGNYIHTPSVMYRYNKEVNKKLEQLGRIGVGDYLQHLLYAQYGNICKLPDYMAVYRQGVGVWSGNKVPYRTEVQWLIAISKLFPLLENDDAKKLLDCQITEYANSILNGVHDANQQLLQIRSSKAYRLGKWLLKPFRWMKKIGRK
jgi:glycosyltransferase involved in cell wall biosynthesis